MNKRKLSFETPIEKEDISIKQLEIEEIVVRKELVKVFFKNASVAPITLYLKDVSLDTEVEGKLIAGQRMDPKTSKLLTEEEAELIESLLTDDLFAILKKYLIQILN